MAQSDFPRPIRVWDGASPRWFQNDVAEWIEARSASGRPLYDEGSRYTALYRHYNKDGALLYVGVSVRALQRLVEHRNGCGWYRQITRIEVEWFKTRAEAMDAEAQAIRSERPRHNIQTGRKYSDARLHPVSR